MNKISVVIPCFDEPDPCKALRALRACDAPRGTVEIIFVVNYGEQVDDAVKQRCLRNYEDVQIFAERYSQDGFSITPLLIADMPAKHAGVGLARKTGMDRAACNKDGLILCFDADAECDRNYFTAIEEYFEKFPRTEAGCVYFEHPTCGNEYPAEIYNGITLYELHLRYYNMAQRMAGLPFAYHTVGSSMFCRAKTYLKAGGMNKRKAGEDFYFLQKLIPHVRFAEINTTRVIPSPRISDRVPFGTGRAMMKYAGGEPISTYVLESFDVFASLVKSVPDLYKADKNKQTEVLTRFPEYFAAYLLSMDYHAAMDELNGNCADFTAFEKRFYTWFNAFRTLKYLNAVHETVFVKSIVVTEAAKLLKRIGHLQAADTATELLDAYRKLERVI